MSTLFPETPILFYPSLARRFGAEEALLLAIYHQYARHHGVQDADGALSFRLRRSEWMALADFWSEDDLARLTHRLMELALVEAEFEPNRAVRIRLLAEAGEEPAEPVVEQQPRAPQPRSVPPASGPAVAARPSPGASAGALSPLQARGPAPAFGGSTGWRKPKDELEALFEQQEKQNRLRKPITLDWRPSENTCQLLRKKLIPDEFFESRIEEFIAYWLGRDHRESNWDHLFVRLVTREWAREQGRGGRAARAAEPGREVTHERDQNASRAERRERITDAVMDIHNTDW